MLLSLIIWDWKGWELPERLMKIWYYILLNVLCPTEIISDKIAPLFAFSHIIYLLYH